VRQREIESRVVERLILERELYDELVESEP
jgi:hypothetical protein